MTSTLGEPVLRVVKGHGTENDFVVVPDLDATVSLSPNLVRALCDRHAGIGADGVLRVARTATSTEPDVAAQAAVAEYFMDYRNADGSIAEMCGNGVRVFGRYLSQAGLISGSAVIATRGGPKSLTLLPEAVSVVMGRAVRRSETPVVTPAGSTRQYTGVALEVPNPHVVVEVASVDELLALDLTRPPSVEPGLPDGQNVEFVVRAGPHHLRLRVHERGVGETRSCGTGICATVTALAADESERWQVDVPGGRCEVWWDAGELVLSGPAVLVAELFLAESWLAEHR